MSDRERIDELQGLIDRGEIKSPAVLKKAKAWIQKKEAEAQSAADNYRSPIAQGSSEQLARAPSGVEAIQNAEKQRGIYEPEREVDPVEVQAEKRRQVRSGVDTSSLPGADKSVDEMLAENEQEQAIPNFTKDQNVPPPRVEGSGMLGSTPFLGQSIWHEPSVEAFKRARPEALARIKAEHPEYTDYDLTNTYAYGEFADSEWAKAYNAAKVNGSGLLRKAFANMSGATSLLADLNQQTMGVVTGFGSGATFGALPEVGGLITGATEDIRALPEHAPIPHGVGQFLGAMRGGPMQAASKLGKVLNIAREGQGALSSAFKSGAISSAIAGSESLGENLARTASDVVRGKDLKENWFGNMMERAGESAKWGAGFGMGFDLLGSALRVGGEKLMQNEGVKTKLKAMFDADMRPKLIGTEKPERARELGVLGKDVAVESIAERRLAEPLKRGVRQMEEELKPYKAALDDYERRYQNHTVDANNGVRALVEGLKRERDRLGRPLPEVIPQTTRDKIAARFFDVRHNPTPEAAEALTRQGYQKLTGESEQGKLLLPFLQPKKGIPVKVPGQKKPIEVPIEVYYKPRSMNPSDMQKVLTDLSDKSGFASGGGEISQETLKGITRGLFKDRDLFPQDEAGIRAMVGDVEVGGYSALNKVYKNAREAVDNIKQQMGIDKGPVRLKDLFVQGKGAKFKGEVREVEITDREAEAIRNYVIRSITDTGDRARGNLELVAKAADRVAGTFGVSDDLRMFRGLLADKGLQNVINPSLVLGSGQSPFGVSRGFLHPEGLRAKGAGILRNLGSMPRAYADKPGVIRQIRAAIKSGEVPPSLKAVARVLIEARKAARGHTEGLQAEGANRELRNYAMPLSPLSQPGPFVGGMSSMRGGLAPGAGVGATMSTPSPDPNDDTVELAGVLYDMVSGDEETAVPQAKPRATEPPKPQFEPEMEEAYP